MTDQELIAAAETAGLCFPRCWGLDDYLNPDPKEQAANRQWIEDAPDPFIRAERQQLVNSEAALAADRLAQLRAFALALRDL